MKKAILIAVIGAFMVSSSAFAKSTNIRVNPLALALGIVNVDVDLALNDQWTVGPSVSLLSYSSGVTGLSEVKLSAFGFGARANYAFNKAMSDGWYFGPFATYIPMKYSSTELTVEYTASFSAFSMGAVIGYQWMWDSFNINLGGGVSYYSTSSTATATTAAGASKTVSVPAFTGIGPSLEFTLGYAF